MKQHLVRRDVHPALPHVACHDCRPEQQRRLQRGSACEDRPARDHKLAHRAKAGEPEPRREEGRAREAAQEERGGGGLRDDGRGGRAGRAEGGEAGGGVAEDEHEVEAEVEGVGDGGDDEGAAGVEEAAEGAADGGADEAEWDAERADPAGGRTARCTRGVAGQSVTHVWLLLVRTSTASCGCSEGPEHDGSVGGGEGGPPHVHEPVFMRTPGSACGVAVLMKATGNKLARWGC